MKIAIIGYGKMGHMVERIARERGHEIVAIIDVDNQADFQSPAFASADVAIEFSTPATALANYERAFAAGVPVVSGTTGWTARFDLVKGMVNSIGASFFWASNFSVGVNIFFELNRRLARIMEAFPQYRPFMSEVHHIHKLDHPSGTAVTLAEGIIAENTRVNSWTEETPSPDDALIVSHIRQGEVPGTHTITWDSSVDSIAITHTAKSREGFALGAVLAAEWLPGHKGVHGMDELMASLLNP
ncbi:MAG: hypothetical protein NC342_02025 [Pseudoflavonifractor sp.]|nr:4-hydroxy-tetrahydrodipicolinate reductase [Alloprevotella sp.]MCM1116302.1 hypothetical protein [Pseudoflavonifractor sp.]